jgi:copper chaperone CopZ
MKTIQSVTAGMLVMLMILSSAVVKAQTSSKYAEVKIKTSAQCGMCKDRIESALAYEKGVKKSVLNLEDKVVTVTYEPKKTSPDKIRQLLSKTGYDADDVQADKTAYEALPACCKKKTSGCKPGCTH